MTDVVEIARSRRARLAAEIARLDEFIHMAGLLRRYGDDPGRGTGRRADEAGLIVPLADSAATKHSPMQNDEPVLTDQPSAEAQRVDAIIGLKLRQRRWMLGMTKKQLADKLGLGIEEIQKYECGATNIGSGRMWHLAAALEVPMSYFFETSDEQTRDTGEAHAASSVEREAPPPAPEVALARTA